MPYTTTGLGFLTHRVVCVFLVVVLLRKGLSPIIFLLDAQHGDQQLPHAHSHVLPAWLQTAFVLIRAGLSTVTPMQLPSPVPNFPHQHLSFPKFSDCQTFRLCFDVSFSPSSLSSVLETKTITMNHGRTQGNCIVSRCLPKTHSRSCSRIAPKDVTDTNLSQGSSQSLRKGQTVSHHEGTHGANYSLREG